MTHHQYGTLKYLLSNNVYVNQKARSLSMITFGSLAKRGWINHHNGLIIVTEAGLQVYNEYHNAKANYRKIEKDISEHVRSLLHIGKLLTIKKAG